MIPFSLFSIFQLFSVSPSIFVTARHHLLKRSQDAMALWVEDVRRDIFKVCLGETKIFDGLHKNIKVVSAFPFVTCYMFRSRRTKR